MSSPAQSLPLRIATREDMQALENLIALSVHGLQQDDYTPEQIAGALGIIYAVDTQLIADGTLFVIETASGSIAGCGGWSKRKTLYGGDHSGRREDALLDPAVDPARIRGFFVHPDWARKGIGSRILQACESAAIAAGFRHFEMAATITGVKLYLTKGYRVVDRLEIPLPNGEVFPAIRMVKSAGQ